MRKNTLECTIVPPIKQNHIKTKVVPCFFGKEFLCNVTCIKVHRIYVQNQQIAMHKMRRTKNYPGFKNKFYILSQ